MIFGKRVKVTCENINQICGPHFLKRIHNYISRNGNRLSDNDRHELAQRIYVRIYRNLTRKIEQRKEQGRRPLLKLKTGKFINYVNKCCLNEIIQYMRHLDKEKHRRVYFAENLDYSRPIEEVNKNLSFSGLPIQIPSDREFKAFDEKVYQEMMEGDKPVSRRRENHLKSLRPQLDHSILMNEVEEKYNPMNDIEKTLEIESLLKNLGRFFEADEIMVLSHIHKGSPHKEIYKKLYSKRHKNVSIVAKKICRIRKKVLANKEIQKVLITSLS